MSLTPDGYRPRLIDLFIEYMMSMHGAVLIQGVKGCGKTWTSLNHANSCCALDENRNDRRIDAIRTDPGMALEGDSPHLIDGWQTVPSVLDRIRTTVDGTGAKGQYILCSSSTPEFKGSQSDHSDLGIVGRIRMHTMSLYESGDSDGDVSLKGLFGTDKLKVPPVKEVPLQQLVRLTMRGGWPADVGAPIDRNHDRLRTYINTLCETELRRIDMGKDGARMKRLIRSLARNESTTASVSSLSRDMRKNEDDTIKDETLTRYIDILDRMFLTENQPAFDPDLGYSKRVGKKPKRHLTDPSIAVSALGLTEKMLLDDVHTFEPLFEAMCERDLQVYAQANGGRLSHYRDGKKHEMDAVVEMPDGRWGAFEIRLGYHQVDEAAEKLLKMREMFADEDKTPSTMCVICGVASTAFKREDGVYVVPITRLKHRRSNDIS